MGNDQQSFSDVGLKRRKIVQGHGVNRVRTSNVVIFRLIPNNHGRNNKRRPLAITMLFVHKFLIWGYITAQMPGLFQRLKHIKPIRSIVYAIFGIFSYPGLAVINTCERI